MACLRSYDFSAYCVERTNMTHDHAHRRADAAHCHQVTNESVIRQRAGIPSHNVSTRQRYPQFFGQLLVPPQEAEYRHFRRLSRYHDDRTRALFALTPAQHEQQSGTWEQPLPMHEYREASLRSSRQLQQVSSPADVPECEPQYGAVQSYKTNATNFCALLDNRVDCKATKDAGRRACIPYKSACMPNRACQIMPTKYKQVS